MKRTPPKILAALAAMLLAAPTCAPTAAASPAADITKACHFAPSSNAGSFGRAIDGDLSTKWYSTPAANRYVDFTLPASGRAGGLYFRWDRAPAGWELFAFGRDGKAVSALKSGEAGYLTQYVRIPAAFAKCRKFRLSLYAGYSAEVAVAEISVYTPGSPPSYAPEWQPFTGRVDLLTIATHPDDEDLYLSVPMVTYGNEGRKCETVFMTYGGGSRSARRFEAQESAWSLGNKYYPDMRGFIDVKTTSTEEQMQYWPLKDAVGAIVEEIRKYKPAVVVTHDASGEYGHGAHKLTSYATALAFQYSGDASKYSASAAKYGTWKAGKLYVHLYRHNALNTMSLTKRLSAFGGRTVLQVVQSAYSRQKSQLPGRSLPVSGPYDMRKFGLVYSNLGPDKKHATMFENVSLAAMLRLNPWYNSVVVNRARLQRALADARSRVKADYTGESWARANLPAAIASAQAIMNDRTATQAKVDAAANALASALSKLVRQTRLEGLKIGKPPDKLAYQVGEPLDLAGLEVTALYSDGSRADVPLGELEVSGFDSSAEASGQAVTVSWKGKKAAFRVDITAEG